METVGVSRPPRHPQLWSSVEFNVGRWTVRSRRCNMSDVSTMGKQEGHSIAGDPGCP